MFELRCTVRACQQALAANSDNPDGKRPTSLFCAAGHHFDRAKQGYWSLLQPQDRKSSNPGDSDEAVLARHRWLQHGFMAGLVEVIRPWTRTDLDNNRTLDLGCGEGSFGPWLFDGDADSYCGIDLSRRAIKLASRAWPEATWVWANADRVLPASDESVGRVVSLFGRRPSSEIHRVLAPGGICIVAVPGQEDLIELRASVQQTGVRRSRWEAVVDEMSETGLVFVQHRNWQQHVMLQPDAIADALAMTYRAVRRSQQARAETLVAMNVTLAADLLLFRRP